MAILVGLLLLLALVIPAPLQEPGDLAAVPNPAKAAWFLLWTQELMGYSKYLVYVIMLVGLYFLLLPYLPGSPEAKRAQWLPKDQLWVSIVTLVAFLGLLFLTVIAMFFRGENWAFVYPF
ncbi:MAG: cytochrome B6 [Desulfobacterales bacterium]|uniref:Cytochrome B6 n=1 Tax=Candidatus Desulfatibia profunda TaxID=2841695 RepID=A0A8J6NJ61_9BACT|nr:cytochrome B6 [Candidatus Desulfatibia profunda]MBL7179629.1 cytochrome B6 [Desulfobacterales bacterium]